VSTGAKGDESSTGRVFGPLNITMLQPVIAWRSFLNLPTVYLFNFQFFFRALVNADAESVGTGARQYQWVRGHDCTSGYGGTTVPVGTGARLYLMK
jgi:hypothetical protein